MCTCLLQKFQYFAFAREMIAFTPVETMHFRTPGISSQPEPSVGQNLKAGAPGRGTTNKCRPQGQQPFRPRVNVFRSAWKLQPDFALPFTFWALWCLPVCGNFLHKWKAVHPSVGQTTLALSLTHASLYQVLASWKCTLQNGFLVECSAVYRLFVCLLLCRIPVNISISCCILSSFSPDLLHLCKSSLCKLDFFIR